MPASLTQCMGHELRMRPLQGMYVSDTSLFKAYIALSHRVKLCSVHGAQDKGVANAATQVSGLELGGLFGSLSSGAISDHFVRRNDGSKGNVGLRVRARHASCEPCNPTHVAVQHCIVSVCSLTHSDFRQPAGHTDSAVVKEKLCAICQVSFGRAPRSRVHRLSS